ncbi:phospholipase A2 [Lepeophtheirus salmonis]|uniref:Phospholipase A2 n=1 Tax=Lepeophtheirus salmonis TaxID=72036 RepID=D3PJX7_LEPSM|nr:phospholipase A2-like [Lepeophtheirus salmonis]ADD38863.1 Phospholipase A2 [Lepeophtheirus salmonis]
MMNNFTITITIILLTSGTTTGLNMNNLLMTLKGQLLSRINPTYWCGFRNNTPIIDAVSNIYPKVDNCCRAHDNCPDFVERRSCKNNLCNPSSYLPLFDCDCEERFRNCLVRVYNDTTSMEDRLANKIGFFYFHAMPSIINHKCMKRVRSGKSLNLREALTFKLSWKLVDVSPSWL